MLGQRQTFRGADIEKPAAERKSRQPEAPVEKVWQEFVFDGVAATPRNVFENMAAETIDAGVYQDPLSRDSLLAKGRYPVVFRHIHAAEIGTVRHL